MGVLGAYGTAIAVVMVSVCVTVFTTTEKPGKQNLEPIGKSSEQSTRISNKVACTKDLLSDSYLLLFYFHRLCSDFLWFLGAI